MTATPSFLDVTHESIVAACPACEWRVISTDKAWIRKVLIIHLDTAEHPRELTKQARDSAKNWLARNAA